MNVILIAGTVVAFILVLTVMVLAWISAGERHADLFAEVDA